MLVLHGTDDADPADRRRRAARRRRPAARSSPSRAPGTARTRAIPCASTCCCATSPRRRPAPARWSRGRRRPKRALFVSSPIGLGHARRDVAIARELRRLHPDLEIDWLAQHPVTAVLDAAGERVHPASRELANESHHIESESAEHDLHCFQAWRRMDEILVANFMVFHDLVQRASPTTCGSATRPGRSTTTCTRTRSEKRAAYVWLTDFVGWLPMADGGEHEAALTADYNAEMIEHIARFPRVRDQAIFVGNPDDVVPDALRPRPAGDRRLDRASTSTSPAT